MTDSSSSLVSGFVKVVPHNQTQAMVHYSKPEKRTYDTTHTVTSVYVYGTTIYGCRQASLSSINKLHHVRAVLLLLHFKVQAADEHLLNYSLSGFHPTILNNRQEDMSLAKPSDCL